MSRRVVITGATGFIGRSLCRELLDSYEIIVLTRSPLRGRQVLNNKMTFVPWDGCSPQGLQQHISGAHAIVNLAGANIAPLRWTREKKALILKSRLNAGRALVEAVKQAENRPRVFIQASGIGYYGNHGDEILDESAAAGAGFLADVAKQWEPSTAQVQTMDVRHAVIRTGVVLGRNGGFIARVVFPFHLFLGGHLGSGDQWLPWVHMQDEVRAIRFLIERDDLNGPYNLSAPNPLKAKEFFHLMGKVLKRPAWLHVPSWFLRLALGEMAEELILSGQRAIPKRLLEAGFEFKFPQAEAALKDVLTG